MHDDPNVLIWYVTLGVFPRSFVITWKFINSNISIPALGVPANFNLDNMSNNLLLDELDNVCSSVVWRNLDYNFLNFLQFVSEFL